MSYRTFFYAAFALYLLFAPFGISAGEDVDPKILEKFKKSYPMAQAERLNKTDIEGMYEVIAPGRIFYYFPEKNYLFAGALWASPNRNLTEERLGEILTEKVKALPLEKALKIGDGKIKVIEFTDPDCPYCRDASKFLSSQSNITRYIFFTPLPIHKEAEQKIKYIFCAKDRERAYEEAMTGKLDNKKFEICNDDKVVRLLNEHKQISASVGINSTPQFWINGKRVAGANINLMKSLLGVK
ncbi:MAG: DsbC family protein [Syntrophorhabdaceae bacterium]|nr:DsbC family protein [Syntrophorhabdaceae bacterium]